MTQHTRDRLNAPGNHDPFARETNPYSLRAVVQDVAGIVGAMWEGRWWIVATTAAVAIPVAIWLIVTPAEYKATAQILLDPRPTKLVEGAVVQNGLGESSVGADTLLVDSQTEIITSRSILHKVVEEQKLASDPEFYKPQGQGIRIKLRNLFGALVPGYDPVLPRDVDAADIALQNFKEKNLFAHRVGNTYVINVGVVSEDPEKAARLANAVAETYVEDQVDFLSSTTRAATTDLEARIEELRNSVRMAEDKVEDFRREKGLIGTPGMLSTEQRLQGLNERLATARAETALARARYERLNENTAEGIAAGNSSQALDNKAVVNLRALLAQAERRLSGMAGELGPQHPNLKRAQDEKNSIMRLIGQELARIQAVARSEYELAQQNEKSLESELKQAQNNVSDNKQALVQLRDYEREAEAAKAVLQSFLLRARETSEQEGLGRASSRIFAPASVPTRSSFPPTKLIALAAIFFGGLLGAFIVWIRHIMRTPEPIPFVAGNGYVRTIDEEGRLLAPVSEPAPPAARTARHAQAAQEDILPPDVLDAFQQRLDQMKRRSGHNPSVRG